MTGPQQQWQPAGSSPAVPPPYGQPPVATHQTGRNGLGTAALVLGIIAVVTCWTVIGGIVLGLLAVIFGIIGRGRVRRGEATNGGPALAGLILGGVGLVLAVVLVAVGATFLVHHKSDLQKYNSCINKASSQSDRDRCQRQLDDDITR